MTEFRDRIEEEIPRLRRYARALHDGEKPSPHISPWLP